MSTDDEATLTLAEFAARLKVSPRKAATEARRYGVGVPMGGSAGWRFTGADVAALLTAMRAAQPKPGRRGPNGRGRAA